MSNKRGAGWDSLESSGSEALDPEGGVLEIKDAPSSTLISSSFSSPIWRSRGVTEDRRLCPERLECCGPGPDSWEHHWVEPLWQLIELKSVGPENPCGP